MSSIKYVGTTLQSDTKFNHGTVTKANQTLGFLRRNLTICSTYTKDPSLQVWDQTWPSTPQIQRTLVYKSLITKTVWNQTWQSAPQIQRTLIYKLLITKTVWNQTWPSAPQIQRTLVYKLLITNTVWDQTWQSVPRIERTLAYKLLITSTIWDPATEKDTSWA